MQSIFDIDSTLKIEETTQIQIRHHSTLVEFINTLYHACAYSFQVYILIFYNILIFLYFIINNCFYFSRSKNAIILSVYIVNQFTFYYLNFII